MYCLDALGRFARISDQQVGQITMEIALIGKVGLDVNDPERRYELRSLPGKFSGLQLVSIMYVGGQRLQPGVDVGFDLVAEYSQALSLYQDADRRGALQCGRAGLGAWTATLPSLRRSGEARDGVAGCEPNEVDRTCRSCRPYARGLVSSVAGGR